jgi:hypothetical protein
MCRRALELAPFIGVGTSAPAWYQACCTLPSGLLGRMLQSYPPRDKEEDLMGLVPVAPHHSPQITIEVESVQAEVDIALHEERTRAGTHQP